MSTSESNNIPHDLATDVRLEGSTKSIVERKELENSFVQHVSDWKPDYDATPRRIVCAAIRKNGFIICGARHYDNIMRAAIRANPNVGWNGWEQGFIDQFGDFLTRKEAWQISTDQNQIRREVGPNGILYSENLY